MEWGDNGYSSMGQAGRCPEIVLLKIVQFQEPSKTGLSMQES